MELRLYVSMLRRWWWLLALGTALAAGSAWWFSAQQTPQYEATATLLIHQATGSTTVTSYNDILTSERLAQTYAALITKRPVLEKAIGDLKLADSPDTLARRIDVRTVRDTQLLLVTVRDSDPGRAAQTANAVSAAFIAQNAETQSGQYATSKEALRAEIDRVLADIRKTEDEVIALGTPVTAAEQVRLASLQTALSQYRATYGNLVTSLQSIELAEAQALNNVSVAEQALPPALPVSPQPLRNALIGAVVGLLLAGGAAFLVEYLDDTVKNPDDVQRATQLPTLAGIARIAGDSKLIALTHPRAPIAEAYRVLRTGVQFASIESPRRTLLVTSPSATEGKTTTAANLAVVMAQAGNKVLLVDSDLRRPMLHKLFDVPNAQGLTNSLLALNLAGTADLALMVLRQAIQPTGVDGLQVLTSGALPPNPSELLGSTRMKAALKMLAGQYDYVILDSPPVLAVTDAVVLATQVDSILLVVDTGRTRQGALEHAAERLAKVQGQVIGVALNRLAPKGDGYYYYYYRDYYHYSPDGSHNGNGNGHSSGRHAGGLVLWRHRRRESQGERQEEGR